MICGFCCLYNGDVLPDLKAISVKGFVRLKSVHVNIKSNCELGRSVAFCKVNTYHKNQYLRIATLFITDQRIYY